MSNKGLTFRGIAYDFNISPYNLEIDYFNNRIDITKVERNSITYIFSSEYYRKKFAERLQENRIKISESLSKRFGYKIKCDLLADLKLYTTIEKRGFLILANGEKVDCLENIILDGNNLIAKI